MNRKLPWPFGLKGEQHLGFRHGYARTPTYDAWWRMKSRCNRPQDKQYVNYGARGIRVCDRWMESFDNFLADMGPKPGREFSLDRIDVNGNYEPSNCRWADVLTQNRNKRTTIRVDVGDGRVLALYEIEQITGVSQNALSQRLLRGWTGAELLLPADMRWVGKRRNHASRSR